MEDITDSDSILPQRVCKDFETKNLGLYHDFYLKNDTLLWADVVETLEKCFGKFII